MMLSGTQRSTAVIGLQWGDEGKGKLVDLLAPSFDAVVRYNGGANAGHSVVVGDERFALHLVPSGVLARGVRSVIGNGVVVDPQQLLTELEGLESRGIETDGLVVSSRAHVVMPYHIAEDRVREAGISGGMGALGTTGRGIGPAYADKVQRSSAVRVADLLEADALRERVATAMAFKQPMFERYAPEALDNLGLDALVERGLAWGESLGSRIVESTHLLETILDEGGSLLFEGANATMLDIDHGTFPYVTSSHPGVHGIGSGTGLPPTVVERVLGGAKAYQTRVGAGPMPTELTDATGEAIREQGREFGTTTGRPRRVGWLDLVALRYSARLNGVTELAVMLLDVLAGHEELRVCTAYRLPDGDVTDRYIPETHALARCQPVFETLQGFDTDITGVTSIGDLPAAARGYLDRIESFVGVPITVVSVGPERTQTVYAATGAAS
ncbi:MAG: adenylosuccinate synthase [Planctomycetota bacterium]